MIHLKWNKIKLPYTRVEWSGSDQQSSRTLTFELPWNPYDKGVEKYNIKLGDLIYLYNDKKMIFAGSVTSREKTAERGGASYTAQDFAHFLLRSNATYKFKNTTPEAIAKKVCSDLGIKTASLAKTKKHIEKYIFSDQCIYDIIMRGYWDARAKTGKRYMLKMIGIKVSIVEKGVDSGITLSQDHDIASATYHDTTDNMVNLVKIYDEKMKQIGQVSNDAQVRKYGVYQSTHTKEEEGENVQSNARAMLVGITKDASIEAIGKIGAVSGRKIKIADQATGLKGTFYITSDTHTFENGVHTMSLTIDWAMSNEYGADQENESREKPASESVKNKKSTKKKSKKGKTKKNFKKILTDSAPAYYTKSGSKFHSCATCTGLFNHTATKTTVAGAKQIKKAKGKNKGESRYTACRLCWKI